MPPPPINPRNCPADPGDDSGLDHGGMKLSEQYSDGHKPQGAPDQETGALGVSHEALRTRAGTWRHEALRASQ